MINDAFLFSCEYSRSFERVPLGQCSNPPLPVLSADDDSDSSPHDLEGGNDDLEYGTVLLNLQNHPSFTQMQVRVSTKSSFDRK